MSPDVLWVWVWICVGYVGVFDITVSVPCTTFLCMYVGGIIQSCYSIVGPVVVPFVVISVVGVVLGTVSLAPLFVYMLTGVGFFPFRVFVRSLFLLQEWCWPIDFGLALVV